MKPHILREYIELLYREDRPVKAEIDEKEKNKIVQLVTCDSREVRPGTLFICKGSHFKEEYLFAAARHGAFCYLSEQEFPGAAIPCILVRDVRKSMASCAALFYDQPWDQLKLVGITATKGKSTTAYFVKSILDYDLRENGHPESGLLSSIETYDGAERFESHLTTPEPLDLGRHLSRAAEHGITHFTMEVSSQALKYGRVEGVRFSVGCFLNIGTDHISAIEHRDWEDYFSSKLRIFDQSDIAVVNLDTEHVDRVLEAGRKANQTITFSLRDSEADFYGYDIRRNGEGIVFCVRTTSFDHLFRLGMPGLFNVENAMAAIAICSSLGVPLHAIYGGLVRARVPGRMEIYSDKGHSVTVIVDYAHNALSFEQLFRSVAEEYPGQSVRIVFGSAGNKAQSRRKDLGEIAGRYADYVYLTEEDPGEENPEKICAEIADYVSAQGCPYTICTDRGKAIQMAVQEAPPSAVILVTGKGAETREKRGEEYITVPSDVDYVKKALKAYGEKHCPAGNSGIDNEAGGNKV